MMPSLNSPLIFPCSVFMNSSNRSTSCSTTWACATIICPIEVGSGSTVSRNSAFGNFDNGINAAAGSTVSGNTARSNDDDGIKTSNRCLVQRNNVSANAGYGLNLGAGTAYRENVINVNTLGGVTGGVDMLGNSCSPSIRPSRWAGS